MITRLLFDRILVWAAFALRLLGMTFFSIGSAFDLLGFYTCGRSKSMALAIVERHGGVNDRKEP